jgi:hypothetical protein
MNDCDMRHAFNEGVFFRAPDNTALFRFLAAVPGHGQRHNLLLLRDSAATAAALSQYRQLVALLLSWQRARACHLPYCAASIFLASFSTQKLGLTHNGFHRNTST